MPGSNEKLAIQVNGKSYEINTKVNSSFTLNDFLRDVCGLKGTKVFCREGGCGCCVVTASKPNDDETFAVNSCMLPVVSCDGWRITTTEGLGNKSDGYHVIQERLAEYNGSQCGFCSPGMVMSMHGLMESKKEPTKEQIEASLDGNICRCTGYRAILDAFKSLSTEECQDIEDLAKCGGNGANGLCNKAENGACAQKCEKKYVQLTMADGVKFYKPTSVAEVIDIVQATNEVRFLVGNTSVGIYKDDGPFKALVDTKAIPELSEICNVVNDSISFGSNVSLTKMIDTLETFSSEPGFKYCGSIAKHWSYVANVPVRNIATWAGNLMTKYHHQEFPSDVFLLLAAVDAEIKVFSSKGEESIRIEDLLGVDMKGKIITKLVIKSKPGYTLQTHKITPRSQNAHAYVNAAHLFCLDENKTVKERPRLFFGGVTNEGTNFIRASETEEFLAQKKLNDPGTIPGALALLSSEITTSDEFRKNLSVSLMYKTILALLGEKVPENLRSGGEHIQRPLMRSEQGLVTEEDKWPLTQPMPRVTAKMQAAGEAEYVNDIPETPSTLFAAFVISKQGNATLDEVNPTEALKLKGALRYICAKDVPGGNNTISPPINTPSYVPEPIFCDGQVHYAGQAIGLIVAKSQQIANQAAKMVKVTYKDVKKPIIDIKEAIEKEMFFEDNLSELKKGDTDSAIAGSTHIIEGEVSTNTQQHFALETQACMCVPTEDLMYVYPTSQYIHGTQKGVSHALGIGLNKIAVEVRRLGGGFGGKIDRNNCVSVPCAIAAHVMRAPVKLSMDANANMAMIGKRLPHVFKYRVGVDSEGKLKGIEMKYFYDSGFTDNTTFGVSSIVDNVYSCDNWHVTTRGVHTNTPTNTYVRTPGSMKAVYFMETIIEHVADTLGKDPQDVRMLNMYKQGEVTPVGEKLSFFKVDEMVKNIMNSANVQERKTEIAQFNSQNRWRKRGLSLVPTRYPVSISWAHYGALVSIYEHDGSVAIAHGGIEMGQGINTKAMQVCANTLGIPLSLVSVRPSQDLATANSMVTGGSITSELCCLAVAKTCRILLDRIKLVKEEFPDLSWPELIKQCFKKKVNLVAQFMVEKSQYSHTSVPDARSTIAYSVYGVTCAEVELDILTGERQISRVDILFDIGESVNPLIDIGQIEGAFAMSIGFFLMEDTKYDENTGENLSAGTWNYKVPTTKDIPVDFRVKLLNWAPNPLGIVRTKAVGEPPMLMGCAVVFALKQAIQEARREVGNKEHFALNTPVTVENTFQLCLPDMKSYGI